MSYSPHYTICYIETNKLEIGRDAEDKTWVNKYPLPSNKY